MFQGPSSFCYRIRALTWMSTDDLLRWFYAAAVIGMSWPMLSVSSMAQDTAKQVPPATATQVDQDAPKKNEVEAETIDLLTEDLMQHWKIFSSAPAAPNAPVWKVIRQGAGDAQELVLVCSGEPKGFLYTTQTFSEFELTLEWKYPKDADGNSGVLVYTQDEPRIWPTSMQVQLHQPKAGSVFPSGDAMSDNTSEAEPNLARPVDTWNESKIVSRGGRLIVEVNSKKAGEVSGAKPSTGSIALQSEGSVVHFRRIRLRKFPPAELQQNDKPAVSALETSDCFDAVFPVTPGSPDDGITCRM